MSSPQDDINRHRSIYIKSKEYPEIKQIKSAEKKEGLEIKNKIEPENLRSSLQPVIQQGNKYSSSDNSDNTKTKSGVINCVCLYQTFDPEMLKCSNCGNFSHKTCYNSNLKGTHQCIQCLSKKGEKCGNPEIDNHFHKTSRSYKEKQTFVFNLNCKRVLKSILNQEFLTCQPGNDPSIEFLKIRFGYSTQYATRITLHLVNKGYIKFFDGFSFNAGLIIEELGLHSEDNELEEALRIEAEEQLFGFGHCYNKTPEHSIKAPGNTGILTGGLNTSQGKGKGPKKGKSSNTNLTHRSETRKRSITPSPTRQEKGKKTRDSSPADPWNTDAKRSDSTEIQFSEGEVSPKPTSSCSTVSSGYRKEFSETLNSTQIQEGELEDPRPGCSRDNQTQRNPRLSSSSNNRQQSGKSSQDNTRNKTCSIEGNTNQTTFARIIRDREGKRFKNKFTWPSRFINSESLNTDTDNTPMSVAELGKRSNKPVFGQVVDKGEIKTKSSDANTSHFHFILGMEGTLVQVWVFGSNEEVEAIEKRIITEEYYVFWGDYNVREKYSSKFKSNSDWAIYLPGKCNKFDLVKKSREYLESEDSISEEREKFADRFKPATRRGRRGIKKMKEHSTARKKLLDTSQRKITDFGIRRTSSSSSTETVSSKNWNSGETNKLTNRSDSEEKEEKEKESSVRIM